MKTEIAIFGGGCFWCTEAVFKMLKGVVSIVPGYSEQAECVRIEYDPTMINFRSLVTVFFGSHDPTTLNRQGNDVGTQYRSVIFYTTPEQKKVAEEMIKEINDSNKEGKPIVTEVVLLDKFDEAEDYHKDYFANNPGNPYCEIVINPKLEKIQKEFRELLKDVYKK